MAVFFRLLRYAVPYRGTLWLAFLLALLHVVVELARPWPVKVVVDYALAGRPLPPELTGLASVLPGGETREGILVWSVVAGVLIVSAAAVLSLGVLFLTLSASRRLTFDLWHDLFEKLQRLSLRYHNRHAVGDTLQRITQDAFVGFLAISQVAFPFVISTLTLVGMFVIMAKLDLVLALLALGVVPLLVATLAVFVRPLDRTTTAQYSRQSDLMALLEQSLFGIKAIQAFAREPFIQRKLEERASGLGAAYNSSIRVSGTYGQFGGVITGIGAAALLGVGGLRVIDGHLTVGDLLVFLGYLGALYAPITALMIAVGASVQAVARGRRVIEVLDSTEEIPAHPQPRGRGRARGEVALEGVTFGYEPDKPVFHNVTLTAEPGQLIAIVGVTGAGKTSLVSLLSRFYDPWAGRVTLDGHDLRELSIRSVRENVSPVLQEPFLFPMSVRENIAFGRPEADEADIVAAAEAARAHGFITRLPDGYDTVLAEKGVSLSGGERQRIAIARALLADAPVLVLDEPSAALDARTEEQVFSALAELMRGKTTFVISHRLSTVRRADEILVLEEGEIVERGTHDELVAKGEAYVRLFRLGHRAKGESRASVGP